MENEKEYNLSESILPDNVFKTEYASQNINKNNIEFRNWQNKMIQKYGRDARLFRCIKDNIIFYTSNEDCKSNPFYQSICPCCNKPICYYCHRYRKDRYENGLCCLSRKLYYFFFKDGLRLINPVGEGTDFDLYLFFFLIPGINLLFFMATMHTHLFYKLSLSNKKVNNRFLITYYNHLKRNKMIFQILVGIDIAFSVVLTFSYVLLNIYFIIIMLIISIPFKFYPMKYLFGIGYSCYEVY